MDTTKTLISPLNQLLTAYEENCVPENPRHRVDLWSKLRSVDGQLR